MPSNGANNKLSSTGDGVCTPLSHQLARLGADIVTGTLRGEAFQPRAWFETTARLGLLSAETLATVLPGKPGLAAQELANKLRVWHLFSYVDRFLSRSLNGAFDEMAEDVSHQDPYSAVWLTEGWSCWYARNALSNNHCRGLLNGNNANRLPVRFLVPLHTGSGIAFAESALREVDAPSLLERLQRLWQCCVENACESYAEMTFEALGLVAILLFPQWVTAIEEELERSAQHLIPYFWHGVGRGLYFLPSTFVPLSATRGAALNMAQRLATTEQGQKNALAGFAWAMTLVNIQHPQVIAESLNDHGLQIGHLCGFSNGIVSAMTLWRVLAPDAPHQDSCQGFQNSDNTWNLPVRGRCQVPQSRGEFPSSLFRVPADGPCWAS